jgi:hypothetical protein
VDNTKHNLHVVNFGFVYYDCFDSAEPRFVKGYCNSNSDCCKQGGGRMNEMDLQGRKGGILIRLFPKAGQVWTVGGENANPDTTVRKALALAISERIIKKQTVKDVWDNWCAVEAEDKAQQTQKEKRLL